MDRQSAPVVDGTECMKPLLACRVPDGKVDTFPTNVDLFVEKRSLQQAAAMRENAHVISLIINFKTNIKRSLWLDNV